MQPAGRRCRQPSGGVADNPAHLVGGQAALGQQRGQRRGARHRLLHHEDELGLQAHVEDPGQPELLHACRAAGSIQRSIGLRGATRKAQQDHLAVQSCV